MSPQAADAARSNLPNLTPATNGHHPNGWQAEVEDLRRLHEVSLQAARLDAIPPLLNLVLDGALAAHGAEKGLISLCNAEPIGLRASAARGFPADFLKLIAHVAPGCGACGASYKEARRIVVEDVDRDPLFADYRDAAKIGGFKSVHSTPLISHDGKLIGVLSVHFSKHRTPDEREMRLMDLYARLAADLVDVMQLRERTRQELAQRRKAEESLHVLTSRFQLAARSEAITLYEQDVDLRYTWLYPEHPEHANALGKTDVDILGGQAVAAELIEWKRGVLRSGEAQRREFLVNLPIGERSYEVFMLPKRDANGVVVGVAGAALDVSERRRAQAASQLLAAIVEGSDDAIVSKDLSSIITSWNKGAETLFGHTADEVIGKPVTILFPRERLQEEAEIISRIHRGERLQHFETVRVRKDGTRIDVSLTVSPVRDREGRIVGASKIARDVTLQKRAERQHQALYELASRVNRAEALPEIYDAAVEAICRCQNAQRASILLFDDAKVMRFRAWRGLSDKYRAAVEGHSPWKSDDPDPQVVCIDDITTASLDPQLRSVVEEEGICALAFIPLTYDRRLLGKFMIYYDLPHRFSAEELRPAQTIASQVAFAMIRQQSGEALEALVDERTASLREAIGQMEEFSYSVSHDLRSPVRAMQGYAIALLEDCGHLLDESGKHYAERILRSSTRMDRLIQDVLMYSRLTRREVQLQRVSLDKLVTEVVQQYPELRSPRAEIVIEHPLAAVIGHEPSLSQVLSNLLSNAVKFVAPGTRPRVEVKTELHGSRVRLWISDNGIGIKPEHQARVFGMFERIYPDGRYEGTGIGLAIVRKAVERMDGAVGLESDGVSGTRFWVELAAG